MNPTTEPARQPAGKKPRLALLLATGLGLGHIPLAPGTWGSLLGVALAVGPGLAFLLLMILFGEAQVARVGEIHADPFVFYQCVLAGGLAVVGLWSADRAAKYLGSKDPQVVVIDEVSGQQLTLLLGGFWSRFTLGSLKWSGHPLGFLGITAPNWKYLLLGFILFRAFDIWKPFPVRQAEALPGGWGIMADDWVAAVYAALCLWLARTLGL